MNYLPAKSDPSEEDAQKNPHVYRINGYWVELKERLANFDGQGSVDILCKLRDSTDSLDRRIWNALYWRTDSWIKSYFGRRPPSDGEKEANLEIHETGGPRWVAWLHDIYNDRPNPINWQTEDLKYILQGMKEMR